MNLKNTLPAFLASLICFCSSAVLAQGDKAAAKQWFRGNLHTHSLWSDGNDFPEMIAEWYAEHGYNFLAISDHNTLSLGQRWMRVEDVDQRGGGGVLERYLARFGEGWVERRQVGDGTGESVDEVRLKPLGEYRHLVESAGKFIMIQGEEISDRAEGKPVHINATNVTEVLRPAGGISVEEAIRNNLRMILQHELSSGSEVLPHLNHPNFGYAVTAEDLAKVIEERFFEVYNGHPDVNQLGDAEHMDIETMWDTINAIRILMLDADPIFGIATDDCHEYHGRPGSQPGRGWVMVQSAFLTPEHLIRAMKSGEFYASSGVALKSVVFESETRKLLISIDGSPEAEYETDFVVVKSPSTAVTMANLPKALMAGSRGGTEVEYQMEPDDLYVRAIVHSSLAHPNPSFSGQMQQAWVQPYGWRNAEVVVPQLYELK